MCKPLITPRPLASLRGAPMPCPARRIYPFAARRTYALPGAAHLCPARRGAPMPCPARRTYALPGAAHLCPARRGAPVPCPAHPAPEAQPDAPGDSTSQVAAAGGQLHARSASIGQATDHLSHRVTRMATQRACGAVSLVSSVAGGITSGPTGRHGPDWTPRALLDATGPTGRHGPDWTPRHTTGRRSHCSAAEHRCGGRAGQLQCPTAAC